jgi:hypothetical protein
MSPIDRSVRAVSQAWTCAMRSTRASVLSAASTHSSDGQGRQRAGLAAATGASSSTAWVLMPPKPKEFTPARRGAPEG